MDFHPCGSFNPAHTFVNHHLLNSLHPNHSEDAMSFLLFKAHNSVSYIHFTMYPFSSVQFSRSVVSRLFVTSWTTARQASQSITNSRSPPKPMSIVSVMPFNHLILCCPLFLLPSIFPSIRVFSNESALRIRWPKYWSFGFNISPSNEHPGLISFRMDWLDVLAIQGTLKSLLIPQFKSINSSVLSFLYGV